MHCRTCKLDKPVEAFYVSQATRCKECTKTKAKENRAANLDYYIAYDKARAMSPERIQARSEYQKTPAGKAAVEKAKAKYAESPEGRAKKAAWIRSDLGKASHAAALKVSALKYPERNTARIMVGNAVRDGRVIPWPLCAVPECAGKPEAHHPDYSRPLDVVWLCTKHHKAAHAIAREAA